MSLINLPTGPAMQCDRCQGVNRCDCLPTVPRDLVPPAGLTPAELAYCRARAVAGEDRVHATRSRVVGLNFVPSAAVLDEVWARYCAAGNEPLPVVAEAIAQAEADRKIAELARTWHGLHRQYRAETEGHLRASQWARQNRALVALVKALDAEAARP